MSERRYDAFFQKATNNPPFSYQSRLAGGHSGTSCKSLAIDIPTGLGKTAAIVLAWLWNRVQLESREWPRRLVYCLPMRTLVEQTKDNVYQWLENLDGLQWNPKQSHKEKVGLHILMGGEEREENPWDLYPEENAILIGTQDMLLSRALNRGYAMSRYRWPMHFGLLNNDCLWIFDEVQLMGNGLATGIQLDAFRSAKLWPTSKPCVTWWTSATQSSAVYNTTDRKELSLAAPDVFSLGLHEREDVKLRLRAEKRIQLRTKLPNRVDILALHRSGQLTLVVANTVKSAQQWYAELATSPNEVRSRKRPPKTKTEKSPELVLLHSRFRPSDRKSQMGRVEDFLSNKGSDVTDRPGMIVVSTQVIEAGIDISAATLWSEIAPWSSVIQRLGRLNRDGRQELEARASLWMPKDKDDEDGVVKSGSRIGPYERTVLGSCEELLANLIERQSSGQPYRDALDGVLATDESKTALNLEPPVIIRPDDVYGLFSSEPDLAGGFTNISPFVRSAEANADVSVYWRDFKAQPHTSESNPLRHELVAIPVYVLARFLQDHRQPAYLWDEDADAWVRTWPNELVPGMTILLAASSGGYSQQLGWTGDPKDIPSTWKASADQAHSLFADTESEATWQTLAEHTAAVASESNTIARSLSFPETWIAVIRQASEWHDVGKAHPRWQGCLPPPPNGGTGPWGKFRGRFVRLPRVRHEALSLIAAWKEKLAESKEISSLALYLIASHHGKVRTLLRGTNGSDVFGWRELDDPLDYLGNVYPVDTSVRRFAATAKIDWENEEYRIIRPSWNSVIEELLGPAWVTDREAVDAVPPHEPRRLGPFNLAYIEAIFRAADARASRAAGAQ